MFRDRSNQLQIIVTMTCAGSNGCMICSFVADGPAREREPFQQGQRVDPPGRAAAQ